MKKNLSVPDGYMTVGELAKKMGTTVRTLQYYDKEYLLPPSAESEGGRRLYTYKDMIRLHQIQSLKSLGFSLDDIRNRLIPLNTPEEVADMLTHQAEVIREKIDQLTDALKAVETLKQEALQMQSVDFRKYADIIVNLQMKNEYYWLIKHFDENTLDHNRRRFDKESGTVFMERFKDLNGRILGLKEKGLPPEDSRVQESAEEFWKMVMEFTGGDMSLLPRLMEFGSLMANAPDRDRENSMDGNNAGNTVDETGRKKAEWISRQTEIQEYLQPALELYFQKSGKDPFGED